MFLDPPGAVETEHGDSPGRRPYHRGVPTDRHRSAKAEVRQPLRFKPLAAVETKDVGRAGGARAYESRVAADGHGVGEPPPLGSVGDGQSLLLLPAAAVETEDIRRTRVCVPVLSPNDDGVAADGDRSPKHPLFRGVGSGQLLAFSLHIGGARAVQQGPIDGEVCPRHGRKRVGTGGEQPAIFQALDSQPAPASGCPVHDVAPD